MADLPKKLGNDTRYRSDGEKVEEVIGALLLKPASNMKWHSNGTCDSAIEFYV